jgi:hypothetical protein
MKRKGGEEKEEMKKDFLSFIEDATKKPEFRKTMLDEAKKVGVTGGEKLLSKFREAGYYDVSLQDCNRILKYIADPKQLGPLNEWAY